MNVFEAIGFAVVVLGTGLFIAAMLILAAFGGITLWRLALRGDEVEGRELLDGRSVRELILGIDQIERTR